MPNRPLRPCTQAGCPNPVMRYGRCHLHQRERPSAAARGYDARWKRLSKAILAEEPRCAGCGRPATLVDHIVPLNDGGTNERSNLQPLCARCHNAKTMRQSVAGR